MPVFRKKPVTVNASPVSHLIRAVQNDWQALPDWFKTKYEAGGVVITSKEIHFPTLEGTRIARYSHWIICDMDGGLSSCADDTFRATYELVNES